MNDSLLNDDLTRRAKLCLGAAKYPGLRRLSAEAYDETVIVSGRVSSFYEKQLAQEIVRHIAGVRSVVNLVNVASDSQRAAVGSVR